MKFYLIVPAVLLSISVAPAEVKFASLFTDHMVLQRDMAVPVWGTAGAEENVTVRFSGQEVAATADASGNWRAELSPLKGTVEGQDLVAAGTSGLATLHDVVVGEVWLCSGQSNMEWPLKNSPNAEKVLAEANFPLIRQFKVKNQAMSSPVTTVEGAWIPCAPDTAGAFTAVGYYFAKTLQPKLGVPIGLINSSWGGTHIEAWLSSQSLTKFPAVGERWKKVLAELPGEQKKYEEKRAAFKAKAQADKAAGRPVDTKYPMPPAGPGTRHEPAGLFNGMIAPLIPYAIRGIIWYQGEGNTGSPAAYAKYLPELITDWRARWKAPEAPFYVVQLPNFNLPSDQSKRAWAEMRDAQSQALTLPATAMVVTIDVGTPDNGHPPDKSAFGARAARLAEVKVYRTESGDSSGPIADSAMRRKDAVKVAFREVTSGLNVHGESLAGFEIAGADGTFLPASAKIEGTNVIVTANGVTEPAAVRYAWANNPPSSLYNGIGLPAAPFSMKVKD